MHKVDWQALVGLHSFTWCDTVGAFAGNGKLIALKIVKSDNDAKQEFTELSPSWDLAEDLLRGIEKVICSFYSSGANASDLQPAVGKKTAPLSRPIKSGTKTKFYPNMLNYFVLGVGYMYLLVLLIGSLCCWCLL